MIFYITKKPVAGPYGGGNRFVIGLIDILTNLGHNVIFDLDFSKKIDYIIVIDGRDLIEYIKISQYLKMYLDTKIVIRVNECDARKNTNYVDKNLLIFMELCHIVIYNSQWLADYYQKKGFNKKYYVCYSGCDHKIFYPIKNKILNKNKIKIVTHHWSDNYMKGYDIYDKLDKYIYNNAKSNLSFSIIGNINKDFRENCKVTSMIEPLNNEELAAKLRENDIYITASRFEPCGFHHIEGSSCGMPILYHKDSGGINESCINHGIQFNDFSDFLDKLNIIINDYDKYRKKIDYNFLSSERCYKSFLSIISQSP